MTGRIFIDPSARTDAGFYQPWQERQRSVRPSRDIRAEIRARLAASEKRAFDLTEAKLFRPPLIVVKPKTPPAEPRPEPQPAHRAPIDAPNAVRSQQDGAVATTTILTIGPLPGASWRRILAEVCTTHEVAIMDLLGPSRVSSLVRARQEAMYRIADQTTMSLSEIGQRMGRDHTTVLHGMRVHAERNGLPILVGVRGRELQVARP